MLINLVTGAEKGRFRCRLNCVCWKRTLAASAVGSPKSAGTAYTATTQCKSSNHLTQSFAVDDSHAQMRQAMAQRKAKKVAAAQANVEQSKTKKQLVQPPRMPAKTKSPAKEPAGVHHSRTVRPTKVVHETDDTASAISDASSCMLIKKRPKRIKAKSTTQKFSSHNRERVTPAKATPAMQVAHAAVSDDDSEGADNLFQ